MLFHLFFLLPLLVGGHPACVRSEHGGSENQPVFVDEGDANTFLGRHLLFNRFDFEMFVQGNLERECMEEVCNYEEAREVFENIPQTDAFWKKYTDTQNKNPARIDVTALLVGLISAAVGIGIFIMLVWFLCKAKCKGSRARSIRAHPRSNASLIMRRLEDVSQQPALPPASPTAAEESHGLPSYEQAILGNGPHDAPPPPYPGSLRGSVRR